MKKVIEWIKKSNRWKHLVGGFCLGFASDSVWCASLSGIGIASALEYKDKAWGGSWNWTDWGVTIAGVVTGYSTRMLF